MGMDMDQDQDLYMDMGIAVPDPCYSWALNVLEDRGDTEWLDSSSTDHESKRNPLRVLVELLKSTGFKGILHIRE